jgi:hypothetical protein
MDKTKHAGVKVHILVEKPTETQLHPETVLQVRNYLQTFVCGTMNLGVNISPSKHFARDAE